MQIRTLLAARRRSQLALVAAALTLVLIPGALGTAAVPARADIASCPWMDPTQSPDQRAHELIAAMTLDQKISIVHQHSWMAPYGTAGYIPGDASLCIPDLILSDSGQGVGGEQQNTVAFAAPIAQTATWDPAMQYGWGSHVGWEAWHKGINIQLAPGVRHGARPDERAQLRVHGRGPVPRQPGRDRLVVAGIQSQHVIATLKHYALNNQETNRMTISSDARPPHGRTRSTCRRSRRRVKQGDAGSVMCSYNRVNLVAPTRARTLEHRRCSTAILKQRVRLRRLRDVRLGRDALDGASRARRPGHGDVSITPGTYFARALKTAVQDGQGPAARLDDMVLRIVRPMFRVGLFDHPPAAEPDALAANVETPDEHRASREARRGGHRCCSRTTGSALPLTRQRARRSP